MEPNPEQQTTQPVNTQPPQEFPHDTPSSFNWSRIFLIILGIILVAGIGFGGYYLGSKKNVTNISNQQAKVSPTPTQATPTSDPTANWQSYTEKAMSLTVKYPNNWSVVEQKTSVSAQFTDGISGIILQGHGATSIGIQWGSGFGGGCPENQVNVNLAGKMISSCHVVHPDKSESWTIYQVNSNTTFKISATADGCPGSGCGPGGFSQATFDTNKQLVMTILANIQFSSLTVDTSNWKTYTDSKNLYSFSYPSTWHEKESSDPVPCVSFSDIPNPQNDQPTHQLLNVCYLGEPVPTTFPYDNGQPNNSTITSVTLNGYSGIRGKEFSAAGLSELVFLKDPKGVYPRNGLVNFTLWQTSNESIFNQILSSFKFTN